MVSEQNSKFAPSGYGLGESDREKISSITDCNTVFANGWYRARGCVNCPTLGTGGEPINYGWLLVSTGDYTRQDFYGSLIDPTHCVRYYVDGIWSEWEWVNPIMASGVEYRTTERWLGEPVYKKAIDLGVLPNTANSYAHDTIPIGVNVFYVGGFCKAGDGEVKPILNVIHDIWVNANYGYIGVNTDQDRTNWSATAIVKYVKN